MSQLFRIVYASRASPKALVDLDGTLRDILTTAIRENRRRDLTGLLVAHRGWFVQALEGPMGQVRDRFGAIVRDPRHRDAVILGERTVDARRFEAWSMCARALSATDDAVLATLDRKPSFNPADMPEASIMRLLTTVADVHGRILNEQVQALSPEDRTAAPLT